MYFYYDDMVGKKYVKKMFLYQFWRKKITQVLKI